MESGPPSADSNRRLSPGRRGARQAALRRAIRAALRSRYSRRWLDRIEDLEDIRLANEALAEAEREGTIPWEQIESELGL